MCESTREAHIRSVREAIAYIGTQLDEGVSLAEVAEVACMSPYHFHRAFRQMTGRGVAQHVKQVRLIRAAVQLISRKSIMAIALGAGFESPDAFTRAFRREFDSTPSEYRKQKRRQSMASPMHGVSVGFIKLPVTDFAKACAFYREALGLKEDFAVEAYGWAQYSAANAQICLYKVGMGGGDSTPGGESGLQLRVADAKRAFEHLKKHAKGGLNAGDDGTISFTVADPDGNLIQVAQVG